MRQLLLSISLSCLLLASMTACGCATAKIRDNKAYISLLSGGDVRIAGSTLTVEEIPGTLRSMGANSSTAITVSIPSSTPLRSIQSVDSVLRRAGFGLIVYSKPRVAGAGAGNAKRP